MGGTLNLGVADLPYPNDQEGTSTGFVAEILERHYQVFSIFYESHKDQIQKLMIENYAGSLENTLMGAPPGNPGQAAMGEIKELFLKFLSEGLPTEFEQLSYGDLFYRVPTKAAIEGINHRKKNPRTGVRRPSLIDTGLFESSFQAWFEETVQ